MSVAENTPDNARACEQISQKRGASSASEPSSASSSQPSPLVSALFIGVVGAFITISYSIMQWRSYGVPSWDLGIFTELAQRYSHFDTPTVDIKAPGYNLLGDHFHPLLVLLAPFYALFPSGLTLLIVQDLLFAASSIPITLLAIEKLGSTRGIAVGAAYMCSWGLTAAVSVQFHEIAFAVPLLAYGLTRWISSGGHSRSALVAFALLVFVKEDLGFTVAAIGAVIVWQAWGRVSRGYPDTRPAENPAKKNKKAKRLEEKAQDLENIGSVQGPEKEEGFSGAKDGGITSTLKNTAYPLGMRTWASLREALYTRRARTGMWLMVWGIAWVLIAIMIVLPAFNPGGAWEYTNRLGENEAAAANILMRFFTPPIKYLTLILLALAAGVLGCFSPYMWIMLPTLAWRFLGNVEHYWGWGWHYSAVLMPIASVALIDTASRWKGSKHVRNAAVGAALASALLVSWPSFFSHLHEGHTPYSLGEEDIAAADGALKALGSGHTVVANLQFLAYAVPGNTVLWEGTAGTAKEQIDAVILGNQSSASVAGQKADEWAATQYGGSWRLVYSERGFQVAVRN